MASSNVNLIVRSFARLCRSYSSDSRSSKVPDAPTWREYTDSDLPQPSTVTTAAAELLERLSLVDLDTQVAVNRINSAIRFADNLLIVNTDGVEPMDSPLSGRSLYLREDEVTEQNCRDELMGNAVKVAEQWYFVAPPGNIPLAVGSKEHLVSKARQSGS